MSLHIENGNLNLLSVIGHETGHWQNQAALPDLLESYEGMLTAFPFNRREIPLDVPFSPGRVRLVEAVRNMRSNQGILGGSIHPAPFEDNVPPGAERVLDTVLNVANRGQTFGICGQTAIYSALADMLDPGMLQRAAFRPTYELEMFHRQTGGPSRVEEYREGLVARGLCDVSFYSAPKPEDITKMVMGLHANQRMLLSTILSFPGFGDYTHWVALLGLADIEDPDDIQDLLRSTPIREITAQHPPYDMNVHSIYAMIAGDGGPFGFTNTPYFAVPWRELSHAVGNVVGARAKVDRRVPKHLRESLQGNANRSGPRFSRNIAVITVPQNTQEASPEHVLC